MVSSPYANNRERDSARLLLLSPHTPIPNSPFCKIPRGNQCVLSDTQEGTKDLGRNWRHWEHTDLGKSGASRRRENWGGRWERRHEQGCWLTLQKADQRVLACFLALTLQETWRLEVEAEAPIFVLAHWLPETRLGTAGGCC